MSLGSARRNERDRQLAELVVRWIGYALAGGFMLGMLLGLAVGGLSNGT